MTHINKYIFAAAMAMAGTGAMAQGLNSGYFTDEFKFRHTMNPAFGNEQNYVSIPAHGNINVNTRGNFGYQNVIRENPMFPNGSDKRMTTFMNPYISVSDALDEFSSGRNRIVGNVGITLLSAGFKAFGGYNTVELTSRTSFGVSLPYELFEFAKNTGNRTYDMGDMNIGAMSYVELGFGHSRQIDERLRVGAKFKLLFGLARADVKLEDMTANLSGTDKWTVSGKATADVSLKGFKYESELEDYNNEANGQYEQVNDVDVDGFGLGGFGIAFDLGAEYKINEDWTVSAALLDLGFISWSDNARAESSGKPFEFDGFHDVAVTEYEPGDSRPGTELDVQTDDLGDQFADFAHLEDKGSSGGRTTGIGATINLGAQYNLPVYRPITFGFLSSTRINGPYTWTEGRLSANYEPLGWLNGGINMSVNSFTTSFGWVINIHPKGYNFFIGMDHILGKLSKEGIPLSSNASLSLGMSVTW